jgi:hypothetical protein
MGFSFTKRLAGVIGSAALLAGCGGTSAMTSMVAQPARTGGTQQLFQQSTFGDSSARTVIYIGNIDGQPGLGNVMVYNSTTRRRFAPSSRERRGHRDCG